MTIRSALTLTVCLALERSARGQTNYQQLKSFDGTNGSSAFSTPINGSDGRLYGTTSSGGISNFGVVFSLDRDGGGYRLLRSFTGNDGEGINPVGLVEGRHDSVLYGTTEFGGTNADGTVFKINKDGSGFTIIHHFNGAPQDGRLPFAGVVEGSDGSLYGTTFDGGSNFYGTIFKLNKDGSGYTVLRNFGYQDGANPAAGLQEGSGGTLYGTTYGGGTRGSGTVYKLNHDGGGYAVLHSFADVPDDGYYPRACPIEASDGLLYGTTLSGGTTNSAGTVFKMNTDGSGYIVLHRFGASSGDGANPWCTLVEGTNGTLYGTTFGGGNNTFGTVFKLNKNGGSYAVVWSFRGYYWLTDGATPETGLAQTSDGTLYGTTTAGGSSGLGTIFKLFASDPALRITRIAFEGTTARLSISGGAAGRTYYIQARTNLNPGGLWQVIGSNTAAIDGSFQFLDTTSSNRSARFYRTATP